MRKQPELTSADYALAQKTVSDWTTKTKNGDQSMIFMRESAASGGHVLIVKTTRTGEGLFITSFRRLSRDQT